MVSTTNTNTGTITIADLTDGISATLAVATPSFSISPVDGPDVQTLVFTPTNCVWYSDVQAGNFLDNTLFSVAGATLTYVTGLTSDSSSPHYQITFTVGGALTITDNSTGYSVAFAAYTPIALPQNPANASTTSGGNASFTASASGYTPPTVQWQVYANGPPWTAVTNNPPYSISTSSGSQSTTSTLMITDATMTMSGYQYEAVFTNPISVHTTSSASLTVAAAVGPTITLNPVSQTIASGETVTFTAAAGGVETPSVQWQLSTNGGSSFSNISGATSTSYSFTALAAENGYQYQAVFTNTTASSTTTAATLSVFIVTTLEDVNLPAVQTPVVGPFLIGPLTWEKAVVDPVGQAAGITVTCEWNGVAQPSITASVARVALGIYTITANFTALDPAPGDQFSLLVEIEFASTIYFQRRYRTTYRDETNGGTGAYACVINVTDSNSEPIPAATVYTMSGLSGGTPVGGPVTSDSGGAAAIMLNPGTQWINALCPGYAVPEPVQIDVVGPATFGISLSPFVVPSLGQYAEPSDMANVFGWPNLVKWAILSGNDPETPAGQAEVQNRWNWALSNATVEFHNVLRTSHYNIPITGTEASVWATRLVATIAGLMLYTHLRPTQRGPDGQPPVSPYAGEEAYVKQQLDLIRSRKLNLDAPQFGTGQSGPDVTHERSRGAYGPGIGGYGPCGSAGWQVLP